MTIKELYEKYGDVELTKEQEKQIKEYLKIKENKKWKPNVQDKYYYVDDAGNINYSVYADYNLDNCRVLTNNCFKTKEETEFRLEQIKVYNELKNFADENNKEICWEDNSNKYHIYYDYNDNILKVYSNRNFKYIGPIYFSSPELAKQAIDKVGADRVKKYLLGVE